MIIHSSTYWSSTNPILNNLGTGQESDTGLIKVGDGITSWNDLAYNEPPTEYTTASGTDTYVADLKMPLINGYFDGMRIRVKFTNTNTGISTINVNGFGSVDIKKSVSDDLISGDLISNGIYELVYDGINFQIPVGPAQ